MNKSYHGWYKLLNPEKFIKPIDEQMHSFNHKNGTINYKSKLELSAFKYADFNKHVKFWSIEPFAIKYIKPTDNKEHRYYIDLFLEFTSGDKFLVEIKPKVETKFPEPPKRPNSKNMQRYQNALNTYAINLAKWNAAKEFSRLNNIRFIVLTEDELYPKVNSKL